MGLLNEYTIEKSNLKKILTGSRMTEISYNETFNLIFRRNFHKDNYREMQFVLTVDAPCWFGNKDEWTLRIKATENNITVDEKADCLLSYELTRLRYNNLIQVKQVDFFNDFLSISFPGENVLSIDYHSESDYAWILEEVGQKLENERMMICCQENELFQNNILKLPY